MQKGLGLLGGSWVVISRKWDTSFTALFRAPRTLLVTMQEPPGSRLYWGFKNLGGWGGWAAWLQALWAKVV